MGEIADVGPRALHDLAVGLDQRIGLARQRGDLVGKRAFEPLGASRPDGGEALGNPLERRQPEPDLEHRGQQQHDREHAERQRERLVERAHLVVDLRGVARDRDQIATLLAEIDGPLEHAQALVLRTLHVADPRTAGIGRNLAALETRQRAVPQRARRAHLGFVRIQPRDLPIPARQRQLEQRLAQRLREFLGAFLG